MSPWQSQTTQAKIIRGKGGWLLLEVETSQLLVCPGKCMEITLPVSSSPHFQLDFMVCSFLAICPQPSQSYPCPAFIIWPGNLEFIFDFLLTALPSSYRDASDWFSNTPTATVPRQGPKVPLGPILWMCSLSVAWFIERQPQLWFPLLSALMKCWKYRIANMARYTASNSNSFLPTAPSAHTQKRLQHQKQSLNPSLPMTGRPGAVFLSQKSGPTTNLPSPTNTGNSLLFLLAASLEAATDRGQAISGVAASRQESGD